MPLLDIATAPPSFHNCILTLRPRTLLQNKFVFGYGKSLASGWKSFQVTKRGKDGNVSLVDMCRSVLVIKAVATLEPKVALKSNGRHGVRENGLPGVDSRGTSEFGHQSSNEDSEKLDEREKLRRTRISKANKRKTPWNKGKKHSPETLQRIRERTRLAMQDPKVKMKLANLGHAQSKETRIKIAIGVRMGWKRRLQRQMLQKTCHFEWQNLIAEASKMGFIGQKELQWNSYNILDEQLQQEWLESIELRKKMPRPKGSKRATKSLEQRRKISEAISAKWADPAYREKVCSALTKYHGTRIGAERKPRRRPSGERPPRTEASAKNKAKDTDSSGNVNKSQKYHTRLRRRNMPVYKDPLASSKLEMIKNIRAQRASSEIKKNEAIEQAKLLIAQAEKAAKVLEVAAFRNPVAQASLIETRKLLAEAVELIESTEFGQTDSSENGIRPSTGSGELVSHAEKENGRIQGQSDYKEINGTEDVRYSKTDIKGLDFDKFNFQDSLNDEDEVLLVSSRAYGLVNGKEELPRVGTIDYRLTPSEFDSIIKQPGFTEQPILLEPDGNDSHEKELVPDGDEFCSSKEEVSPNSVTVSKKWVRGRLVEVVEGH
ncbi:hypothetical protein NMG60_11003976 [Bertholletia excelsa]